MGNPYAAKTVRPKSSAVVQESAPSVQADDSVGRDLGVADLNVSDVLDLVGTDKELAIAALNEEKEGKARKTLISELEEIVDA